MMQTEKVQTKEVKDAEFIFSLLDELYTCAHAGNKTSFESVLKEYNLQIVTFKQTYRMGGEIPEGSLLYHTEKLKCLLRDALRYPERSRGERLQVSRAYFNRIKDAFYSNLAKRTNCGIENMGSDDM